MFYSRAIAFGRYPFPSVSYVLKILKSKNFLDFFTNLFERTLSFRQLCIGNGGNGHFFGVSQENFPFTSDNYGRKRNHALFYQLFVPKSPNSEYQRI